MQLILKSHKLLPLKILNNFNKVKHAVSGCRPVNLQIRADRTADNTDFELTGRGFSNMSIRRCKQIHDV